MFLNLLRCIKNFRTSQIDVGAMDAKLDPQNFVDLNDCGSSLTVDEVITNKKIPEKMLDILKNAKEFFIGITPYFSPWEEVEEALKEQAKKGVKIVLLIRRDKESEYEQLQIIKELKSTNVDIFYFRNLHAKVYLNEKEILITSMNMTKSSLNNFELGVFFQDKSFIEKFKKEIIFDNFDKGFCCGCGNRIPFDISGNNPLCNDCFTKFKIKDFLEHEEEYKEIGKYCYFCGKWHRRWYIPGSYEKMCYKKPLGYKLFGYDCYLFLKDILQVINKEKE